MKRNSKVFGFVMSVSLGLCGLCSLTKVNAVRPLESARYIDQGKTYDVFYNVFKDEENGEEYLLSFDLKDADGNFGECPFDIAYIMTDPKVLNLNGREVSAKMFNILKYVYNQSQKIFVVGEGNKVGFSAAEIRWYKDLKEYAFNTLDLEAKDKENFKKAVDIIELGNPIATQEEYDATSFLRSFIDGYVREQFIIKELNDEFNMVEGFNITN